MIEKNNAWNFEVGLARYMFYTCNGYKLFYSSTFVKITLSMVAVVSDSGSRGFTAGVADLCPIAKHINSTWN